MSEISGALLNRVAELIAQRCGEPVSVVLQVMEAEWRRQNLSGLHGVEEDDELLRERAAMSHLLPDHLGTLDPSHPLAYLVQATGLSASQVRAILAAQVGLVTGILDLHKENPSGGGTC